MDSWRLANFTTAWFVIVPLIAAYVPHRLLKSYFNHHVWRYVRALLSLVDPDVTVDIARRDVEDDSIASSYAYNEVKAYLSAACSREAHALRAESAVEGDGSGFVLSLRLGQEIADVFRGAVLWWSCVEAEQEAGIGNAREGELVRRQCHRRHRQLVVDEYLPHVRRNGRDALYRNRRRRLHTNNVICDYG